MIKKFFITRPIIFYLPYFICLYKVMNRSPKKKKLLKFVHITKTGGTSIEELGQKYGHHWGKFDIEYRDALYKNPNIRKKKDWYHYPIRYIPKKELSNLKKKYDFFTVVRNPYSRVVSEYYCEWGGYPRVPPSDDKKQFNKDIHDSLLNMKQWIEEIKEGKSSPIMHGHNIPEYLFVYDESGRKIVKNVIYFEDLDNQFNDLMKKYNVNIHMNKNFKKNPSRTNVKVKFTEDDLSKENIKLINEIYAQDFQRFKYQKKGT